MEVYQLQLIHPNFNEKLVYYLNARSKNQILNDVGKSLNNRTPLLIFDTGLNQWVTVPYEVLKASIIHI